MKDLTVDPDRARLPKVGIDGTRRRILGEGK